MNKNTLRLKRRASKSTSRARRRQATFGPFSLCWCSLPCSFCLQLMYANAITHQMHAVAHRAVLVTELLKKLGSCGMHVTHAAATEHGDAHPAACSRPLLQKRCPRRVPRIVNTSSRTTKPNVEGSLRGTCGRNLCHNHSP